MSKSPYKQRQAASLKGAVNDLVTAAGGQEAAADVLSVTKGTVFRWTDDSEENAHRHMPVQAVRTLERHVGQPIVTAFLAAEAGHALVASGGAVLPADWGVIVATYAKEASEAFAKLATAIADGVVTPDEARAAMAELDQVQAYGAEIREKLKQIAENVRPLRRAAS